MREASEKNEGFTLVWLGSYALMVTIYLALMGLIWCAMQVQNYLMTDGKVM